MQEISDISIIVAQLKAVKWRLIGIDGVDGSGKSTLAEVLSKELGYIHLNVDDYLEENLGHFVKNVKYNALRSQLDQAQEPVIIEGVCLLAVLQRLQLASDLFIYVKRISENGRWCDENDCDIMENVDKFVEQKKEDLKKFAMAEAGIEGRAVNARDSDYSELDEEIIRYHYKFKPHKKAHIIYKRIYG